MTQIAYPIRLALPQLESVAFAIFGDSYGKGGAGADDGTRFLDRVASRQRTATPANYAIGGTRSDQILSQVQTNWAANSRGLVGLADVVINDVRQYADDASKATTAECFRAILARLTAWAVLDATSASLVYGPGWTGGATTTAGAYVDVAWTGDTCHVLVPFTTAAGTTLTVKNASTGATVKTVTTGGYKAAFTAAVKLSGYGSGNHTVRIVANGSASVLGVIVPSPTPPTIVWFKPGPYLNGAPTQQTLLAAYLAVCATVAAEFAGVVPVAVDAAWDNTTMLGPDGLHPNDKGHVYIANLIERALLGVGFRQGLNQLSAASAGTYTAPAPAYASPGATTPAAPTAVSATAGYQAVVTWTRAADGGSTLTSQVVQASTDGTTWVDTVTVGPNASSATITNGLAAGTSYTFRVIAVNGIGRGTPSAASGSITAGQSVTVYAADDFNRTGTTLGSTSVGALAWIGRTAGGLASSGYGTNGTQATGGIATATADTGHADGTITATFTAPGTVQQGIEFRRSTADESGFVVFRSAGAGNSYKLSRRSGAGAYTTLYTAAATPAAGDILAVVLNGSSITMKINGATVFTTTDTVNQTATNHGLWGNGSGAIWDDWSHTSVTT